MNNVVVSAIPACQEGLGSVPRSSGPPGRESGRGWEGGVRDGFRKVWTWGRNPPLGKERAHNSWDSRPEDG